jgi:hypothetical protein
MNETGLELKYFAEIFLKFEVEESKKLSMEFVGSAGEKYVSFFVSLRKGSVNHVCFKLKRRYNYQYIKFNYASSDIFLKR